MAKKLKDIILYNGSLEELNSVSQIKYKIADLESYSYASSKCNIDEMGSMDLFKDVRKNIEVDYDV